MKLFGCVQPRVAMYRRRLHLSTRCWAFLKERHKRGFSIIEDTYAPGISAMSAPVQRAGKPAIGVVLITGPSARLTLKRMEGFGSALLQEAAGRI